MGSLSIAEAGASIWARIDQAKVKEFALYLLNDAEESMQLIFREGKLPDMVSSSKDALQLKTLLKVPTTIKGGEQGEPLPIVGTYRVAGSAVALMKLAGEIPIEALRVLRNVYPVLHEVAKLKELHVSNPELLAEVLTPRKNHTITHSRPGQFRRALIALHVVKHDASLLNKLCESELWTRTNIKTLRKETPASPVTLGNIREKFQEKSAIDFLAVLGRNPELHDWVNKWEGLIEQEGATKRHTLRVSSNTRILLPEGLVFTESAYANPERIDALMREPLQKRFWPVAFLCLDQVFVSTMASAKKFASENSRDEEEIIPKLLKHSHNPCYIPDKLYSTLAQAMKICKCFLAARRSSDSLEIDPNTNYELMSSGIRYSLITSSPEKKVFQFTWKVTTIDGIDHGERVFQVPQNDTRLPGAVFSAIPAVAGYLLVSKKRSEEILKNP